MLRCACSRRNVVSSHRGEYALIMHDSALPKPMVRGCRAASKRNGILSTELVSKGELPEAAHAVLGESREEIFKVPVYSKP